MAGRERPETLGEPADVATWADVAIVRINLVRGVSRKVWPICHSDVLCWGTGVLAGELGTFVRLFDSCASGRKTAQS
jgi:hypothetical protein